MQKVDRLGWAVGFSLKTYGLRVGIRANDAAGLERVCAHLPHGWEASTVSKVDRLYSIIIGRQARQPNLRPFNLLYGDHVRLARSTDVDQLFQTFESDLRLVVAEFAPRHVFVHAGVVGWKGKAILIPGRSFSGKSTLVTELVKAGASYYSDEFAVLDSRGRVHPFRKPIELREKKTYRQSKLDLVELGGKEGNRALPVGLVLMTKYKEGARWRPRRLTAGEGVLALLENTVSARRAPAKALSALQQASARASIFRGTRGEAREIATALLDLIDLGN
jgi:hypothetical protein